jgi:peptidoglycan/LPS O-acetylase OafA/YrhL
MNAKADNRIIIFDILRGIAAFIVAFHHLFSRNYEKFEASFSPENILMKVFGFVSDLNHLAVLFFFILSGYSIGIATKGEIFYSYIKVKQYFAKRALRILPLYFLSIFLCFVVGFFINKLADSSFSIKNLLGNVFFLQTSSAVKNTWFIPFGLNGPFWSLSYEVFFYILFPVIIYWGIKISLKLSSLKFYQATLLLAFFISIVSLGLQQKIFIPYFSFASLFCVWYLGYYLYQLNKNNFLKTDYFIIAVLLFISCFGFFVNIQKYSATLKDILQGIIIFITWLLIKHFFAAKVVLKNKGIVKHFFIPLGDGSFAIYLIHFPILLLLMNYCNSLLVISILLTICCIGLIFIEKKMVAYSKIISKNYFN